MGLGQSFRPTNIRQVEQAQRLAQAQEVGKRASTRGGSPFEILMGTIAGAFTGGLGGAAAGGLSQALGQKSALAPEAGLAGAFQGGLAGFGAQRVAEQPSIGGLGALAAGITDPGQLPASLLKIEEIEQKRGTAGVKARKEAVKLTADLRKELDTKPEIKEGSKIFSSLDRMNAAWDDFASDPGKAVSKNALDQALVITFNKMLDPGSVVRESEFARTPEGQALMTQLQGFQEKIKEGGVGLTNPEREEIVRMANILGEGQLRSVQQIEEFFRGEATKAGLDPTSVVRGLDFRRPQSRLPQEATKETAIIDGVPYEIVRDAEGKAIGRRPI